MGFRLGPEGATYGLALDKKDRLEISQPCTFLVEHGDGTSYCGIYEDRPIACVTYPMTRVAGRVALTPSALCPPGAWTGDEESAPHWMAGLRRVARYRDTYVEVVNRWNGWVAAHPDRTHPPEHFVAYVLQVYDRLDRLDRKLGDEALATVERTWASLPPGGPVRGSRDGEPAWLGHLRRIRAAIDDFFPELPPLPFARIAIESGSGQAGLGSLENR